MATITGGTAKKTRGTKATGAQSQSRRSSYAGRVRRTP